jgi:hypothetical protein
MLPTRPVVSGGGGAFEFAQELSAAKPDGIETPPGVPVEAELAKVKSYIWDFERGKLKLPWAEYQQLIATRNNLQMQIFHHGGDNPNVNWPAYNPGWR